MRRLALIVEYEAHPGQAAAFDQAMRAHATACLAEEKGCLRFEILRPLDEHGKVIENRFMANELFADEAALDPIARRLAGCAWRNCSSSCF